MYLSWCTQKNSDGETRTYLRVRDSSGKVVANLGRYPTPQEIKAAVEKYDIAVAKAPKEDR